jgi:hypothetical protein
MNVVHGLSFTCLRMGSASAAKLTAELAGLSVLTGLGDVLTHRCLSVGDERA